MLGSRNVLLAIMMNAALSMVGTAPAQSMRYDAEPTPIPLTPGQQWMFKSETRLLKRQKAKRKKNK